MHCGGRWHRSRKMNGYLANRYLPPKILNGLMVTGIYFTVSWKSNGKSLPLDFYLEPYPRFKKRNTDYLK
jgi:hypothetical protein